MGRGIIIAMASSLLLACAAAYYATVIPGRVHLTEPIEIVGVQLAFRYMASAVL